MPSDHIPPPPAYAPQPAGPSPAYPAGPSPAYPAGPSPEAAYATSYEPRPARAGLDRGTKRLVVAACGLGAVLAAVAGGWALRGGDRPVPVFEADGRPLRVKPDNPGGMQVAGLDDLEGKAAGMAPKPEAPSPQALRAQMPTNPDRPAATNAGPGADPAPAAPPSVAAQPASPHAAVPPSTKPSSPPRATAAGGTPGGGAGATSSAPAASTPAAPAAAAPASAAPASAAFVQLAAVESEQTAQAEWQRLSKRMPELLGGRKPTLQRVERDGRTIWRVRTGGFADLAEAASFCGRVRAKGASCSIASF